MKKEGLGDNIDPSLAPSSYPKIHLGWKNRVQIPFLYLGLPLRGYPRQVILAAGA